MAVVLGIDSSSSTIGVAVIEGDLTIADILVQPEQSALSLLAPAIDSVIKLSRRSLGDLDLIAVTRGPGSWSGTRIAIQTAKALAMVTRLPIVGVSSLTALAYNLEGSSFSVMAIRDAKSSRAYIALYDCRSGPPVAILEPQMVEVAKVPSLLDQEVLVVGDVDLLPAHGPYRRTPKCCQLIRGHTVAQLGERQWKSEGSDDPMILVPEYLQASVGKAQ